MAKRSRKDCGRNGVLSAEEEHVPDPSFRLLFRNEDQEKVLLAYLEVLTSAKERVCIVCVCEGGGQRSTLAVVPQIPAELTK